jgi:hypothetical protein
MHAIKDTRMPIHHVTYAMPNARNAQGKLYICYKGAPTHTTYEIKKHKAPPANE